MSNERIVDIAIVELNGQELQTIRSMTVKKSDPKAAKKTMRRKRRALGVTRGVPDFTVDLEVVILVDPEVDWDALFSSGSAFVLAYEKGEDGKRRKLAPCYVDDISEPYDSDGETMVSVSIIALDDRPEN